MTLDSPRESCAHALGVSVGQLSRLCRDVPGFEDEACFGRFFKKYPGHRPTEFRAMAQRRLAAA